MWTRREFLTTTSAAVLAAALQAREEDLWSTAADILKRIKDPVFPSRDVNITAHGAKGDGTIWLLLPMTIVMAIVSPAARARPSMTAPNRALRL